MVAVADFGYEYPRVHERLIRSGWCSAEVQGLLDDWPAVDLPGSGVLAEMAANFAAAGTTPVQARAWLRVLVAVTWGCPSRTGLEEDLVRRYGVAAHGDHDLAVLAYQAGVTIGELADGLAAGRISRDSLLALVGLRRTAVAV